MSQLTQDDVYFALEAVSWGLRWELPEVYEKVDEVLANPNRNSQSFGEFMTLLEMKECLWCGEFTSSPKYCNKYCCDEHKRFLARRNRIECAWCGNWATGKRLKYCSHHCQTMHREFNFKRAKLGLKPT